MNIRPLTYVFDLDGVIYRGNEPQPHASETLLELRHRGHKIFFLTNNATKSREDYQCKLAGMNIPAPPEEIMTSAHATALYVQEESKSHPSAYVVGEPGLISELESVGVEVVSDIAGRTVDYVIVGLDRQFTYEKMKNAQHAITAGAKFIATNRDATFPLEQGRFDPGAGAVVSAIETASQTKPVVIGKPYSFAVRKVLDLAEAVPESAIMVGDRLDTDIAAGNRIGMRSVLVLTGVSSKDDADNAPLEMRPQRIITDLAELLDMQWGDE